MKVELLGWETTGLRCPDASIELTHHGKVAPVALIQMPNGTGKTTTLQLLTASLDGSAAKWTADRVRNYRRAGDSAVKGQFLTKLLVDGRPLTFELTLDFAEGHARYRTTAPGSGGVVTGHHPTSELKRFLTPQFTSLFVFDGEFADGLLDSQRSEAERAIDALCQLYLLGEISEFADQEWQKATKRGGAGSPTGILNLQNRRTALATRINKLSELQLQGKKEQIELDERIAKLGELIATHVSRTKDVSEAFGQAKDDLASADQRVTIASNKMMQAVRMPHFLHPCIPHALVSLKENLDHLKLPENTSAQFFEELTHADSCVCGREMTEEARIAIKERAKKYLGDEEAGVINALKKDIDQFTSTIDDEGGLTRLSDCTRNLSAAVRDRAKAESAVRNLKQQLIDQGDEKMKELEAELQEKQQRLSAVVAMLRLSTATEDAQDKDDSEIFSISVLQDRLSALDTKISELTQTRLVHEQTKLIKKIAAGARQVARDRIRALVLAECNERLRRVLSQDPIELESIGNSLHLAQQTGASVGQTLAVGYTFLMSVLYRGQNQFPLIVDSPANPLDAGRRRAIGTFIPKLCNQFVGFTISTERLGFINALEGTGVPIKYITQFRKTDGTRPLMTTLPPAGVAQTSNGVVVEDRDYFHAFDLNEETD